MWGDIFDSILTGGGIYLWLRFIKRDKNCCFWNSSFGVWDTDNVSVRLAPDHDPTSTKLSTRESWSCCPHADWAATLLKVSTKRFTRASALPRLKLCTHRRSPEQRLLSTGRQNSENCPHKKCFKKGRHLIKPSLFSFNFVPKSRP